MKAFRRAFMLVGLLVMRLTFGAEYSVTPADYLRALPGLKPGDTLRLAPGHYTRGLPIRALHGEPGRPIVITGPANG